MHATTPEPVVIPTARNVPLTPKGSAVAAAWRFTQTLGDLTEDDGWEIMFMFMFTKMLPAYLRGEKDSAPV